VNILNKIVLHKKEELKSRKAQVPLERVKNHLDLTLPAHSFKASLLKEGSTHIIAEFKRQSPSKGLIHKNADVLEIVDGYIHNGASALSVLTESEFFKGSDKDFLRARNRSSLPMIRKDFMIDEYQFYEAKSMRADAVLLIASILNRDQVYDFTHLAHSLDMEVLLEVHSLRELEETYFEGIDMVGVNNRDLTSFEVDVETSFQLIKNIPDASLKISESGISDPEMVAKLLKAGFKGFLIGETFMKHENPGLALKEFVEAIARF